MTHDWEDLDQEYPENTKCRFCGATLDEVAGELFTEECIGPTFVWQVRKLDIERWIEMEKGW